MNIAVIDEVNGSVIASETFKTHESSSYSNHLTAFIEKVHFGAIVCMAISNDGVHQLNALAKQTIKWLGSSKIYDVHRYESWALIGVKGAHPGQALEVHENGDSPVQVSARITLKPFREQIFKITAESAGKNYGNFVIITLNGTVVDIPYVGHDRGLHVMVVNEVTGVIVHRQVFDTSAESGAYSSSNQLVELIQGLPKGRLVAIAIKEEAFDHLSEEAKRACESIGSALIRQVHHGGSWAIIGQKGASIGSVPEAIGNSGTSKSYLILPEPLPAENKNSCFIIMQALDLRGINSFISVNGFQINHTTEGSLVAALKDGECEVEHYASFTSPDDLAEFIKYIPHGRTVLVNLAHNYRGIITGPGSAALEAIGSARMHSLVYDKPWVLIGRKGAPKGSIIEESYPGLGRGFEAAITVQRTNSNLDFVGSVVIQSAGEDLGNYGNIIVDGQTFTIPAQYKCGINVAVWEEDSTNIRLVDTFNMTVSNISDNLDIDRFINLTHSLTNGTVMALTTNDAAGLNETEKVVAVIEQLGSRYIHQATEGGSWAMMCQKGAETYSVLEAASKHGPVEILTHTLPGGAVKNTTCKIFVESSGTGSYGGDKLILNGKVVSSDLFTDLGIRIATLKSDSCELESIITYPTHVNYQHAFTASNRINAMEYGTIVIATVYGSGRLGSSPGYWYRKEYSRSQSELNQALQSIGSSFFGRVSYRDAWAIIGKKGAPPGSVPESHVRSLGHELSSALAVGGIFELGKCIPCESSLYPIDCLLHN